jgi:hypothetical protein
MTDMTDPRVERWTRPVPWDPESDVGHLRDLPPGRLLEIQRSLSELCTALALSSRTLAELQELREPMSEPALSWWLELVRRGRAGDGRQRP